MTTTEKLDLMKTKSDQIELLRAEIMVLAQELAAAPLFKARPRSLPDGDHIAHLDHPTIGHSKCQP